MGQTNPEDIHLTVVAELTYMTSISYWFSLWQWMGQADLERMIETKQFVYRWDIDATMRSKQLSGSPFGPRKVLGQTAVRKAQVEETYSSGGNSWRRPAFACLDLS